MGNPSLGQGTATDGTNWVGHLVTEYNTSVVLSYNFARYGATINDSVVYGEPDDLVYQVTQSFHDNYCISSRARATWDPETSLFVIWIGINDVYGLYSRPYLRDTMYRDLESYFVLADRLYDCGARRFLIFNIPPISRAPRILLWEHWRRKAHRVALDKYNSRLATAVQNWKRGSGLVSANFHVIVAVDYGIHDEHRLIILQATMDLYDSHSFTTEILDNPNTYGFDDNTCTGGARCIWWDGYHPSSVYHRLLAADVQRKIESMI